MSGHTSTQLKVCVIDADLGDVKRIRRDLKRAFPRCAVHDFDTIEAGLADMRTSQPDVVVLDLGTADRDPASGNGSGLGQVVECARAVPVIALAADGDLDAATLAIREGAQDCLFKASSEGDALVRAITNARERLSLRVERDALRSQMESILDITEDGILVVDPQGKIRRTNRAAVELLRSGTPGALVGRGLEELLPGVQDLGSLTAPDPSAPPAESELTTRLVRDDGRTLMARYRFESWVESGEGASRVFRFSDITEVDRLTHRVDDARRLEAFGHVAVRFGDQFGRVLSDIEFGTRLLKETLESNHPAIRQVDRILETAYRAESILNRLEQAAQRGMGRHRRVHLGDLVDEARSSLTHAFGEDLDIDFQLPDGGDTAVIDPDQVRQVIVCLAQNACESYNGASSRPVAVGLELGHFDEPPVLPFDGFQAGEFLVVNVSDQGRGIDPETVPHVFEPFCTTKDEPLAGLGLATVLAITRQHGGVLEIDSAPGQGTRVRVCLRCGDEASAED